MESWSGWINSGNIDNNVMGLVRSKRNNNSRAMCNIILS